MHDRHPTRYLSIPLFADRRRAYVAMGSRIIGVEVLLLSTPLKVVNGPVDSDGVLMRLVELPDGSGRVEIMRPGGTWEPGGDVTSVMLGSPVTPEILEAFGATAAT